MRAHRIPAKQKYLKNTAAEQESDEIILKSSYLVSEEMSTRTINVAPAAEYHNKRLKGMKKHTAIVRVNMMPWCRRLAAS